MELPFHIKTDNFSAHMTVTMTVGQGIAQKKWEVASGTVTVPIVT